MLTHQNDIHYIRDKTIEIISCGTIFYFILISSDVADGYYVACKPITLSCILFMFIEMKFIHCHSCVMFAMKSMSMCND